MNEFTLLHVAASWCTPLHNAIVFDKTKIVKVLLAVKGIDVNVQNGRGETPLHRTNIFNNTEIREALLEAGADPDIKGFCNKTSRDLAKG
ncbi:ankyrin repeat domain-containing protein [Wolbachia endosymbiont (group A) of Conops quadrifasciatus]|uniref:ankyrin repeat domain-containing protein n=1 Tax=Wolbachia endosymbiont (group A) of Conops quadrifasciatus TaxID=3066143 RepID=UPI003132E0F9